MKYLKLKFLLMFFALAMAIPPAWAETKTDVITHSDLTATSTTYTAFSNLEFNSDARYSGVTARYQNKTNYAIQLNNGKNANGYYGIVSTTSGGVLKKVTIAFRSNTTVNRVVNIYGKNSAYTSSSELYNDDTTTPSQDDIIGTAKYTDSNPTVTIDNIDGDYQYVGICANSGAVYILSITIEWETGGSSSLTPVTTFSFPQQSYSVTLGDSFDAPKLTVDPSAAADEVVYSSNNTSVATVDASTGAVTIKGVGTTTITASISGSTTYDNASTYYTLTVQEPPLPVTTFHLVTNVNQLSEGKKIIFVSSNEAESAFAMSKVQNNNNRGQTSVTVTGDLTVDSNNDVEIFTLEKNDTYWNFLATRTPGYIYAAGTGSNNYLRTESEKDAKAQATVTIDSDGEASVIFNSTGNNVLQHNASGKLFSCYASASQQPVYIYVDDPSAASIPELIVAPTALSLKEDGQSFTVHADYIFKFLHFAVVNRICCNCCCRP